MNMKKRKNLLVIPDFRAPHLSVCFETLKTPFFWKWKCFVRTVLWELTCVILLQSGINKDPIHYSHLILKKSVVFLQPGTARNTM